MVTISDAGINVQISRETTAVGQKSFGSLLFLDPVASVTERAKLYTSLAGLSADYQSTDEAYIAGATYFAQSPTPREFIVGQALTTNPVGDELDLIASALSDFYCVVPERTFRATASDIIAIATWVEANERVMFNTDNNVAYDTAIALQTQGFSRTLSMVSSVATEYPDASAFGVFATTSYRGTDTLKTLKFKNLPTITTENIDAGALLDIKNANANVLYTTAGVRMVDSGAMADGSWADEVIGADALAEQIRVNVFGLFARTSTKIPYTERGVALIEAEVEQALDQFKTNGFIAEAIDDEGNILPAFTISHTPVRDVATNDKANRIAPDIEFTARLAGAIHTVLINGRLVL